MFEKKKLLTINCRASSRETRTSSKGGIVPARKVDDTATDVADLLEDKGSMVVPQAPQMDTKRTSRRGGSSRTASRSSSPGGSIGIPDEDETDESENMDLGNVMFLHLCTCFIHRY